jgi:hypothetical protein
MGILNKSEPKKLRIKLSTSIAGQRINTDPKTGQKSPGGTWAHTVGAIIDWPEDEARRMIEAGHALPAEGKELQFGTLV